VRPGPVFSGARGLVFRCGDPSGKEHKAASDTSANVSGQNSSPAPFRLVVPIGSPWPLD
jgi:hypothetical protein